MMQAGQAAKEGKRIKRRVNTWISAIPSGLDLYDAGPPTLTQLRYYYVVPPGLPVFRVF